MHQPLPLARFTVLLLLFASWAASSARAQNGTNFPVLGEIIRLDPALDELVPPDAEIEVLASGFVWSEGPVWISEPEEENEFAGYLLFSDIPKNAVMRWQEGVGISIFMQPSGYTGVADYGVEPGSNGLLLDAEGRIVFCEHGDRRISVLYPDGGKRTLANSWDGKRLNSPNDAALKSNGDIYFTDPPYGLPERFEDPRRELDFCGVYRISAEDGSIALMTDEMTRPNGIAFSPDERTLYVAQSVPEAAIWKAFPVSEGGTLGEGQIFADVTENAGTLPGLPDGMKVDAQGNLFATGPGGVHVFTPEGKLLGRISTGERTANLAWGNDGTVLYLTADMFLCRVKTTTVGAGW